MMKSTSDDSSSRRVPNKIQWISSDDSSISGITLPSFQKRKTIINKVDQFLHRFKIKKRKLSNSPSQIQTTATKKRLNTHEINERSKNSRVHKLRKLFSIPKKMQKTITIDNTGRR